MSKELEEYKALVYKEALKARAEEGWSCEKFNAAMERLGIDGGSRRTFIEKLDKSKEGTIIRRKGYVYVAVKSRRGWTTIGWREKDFNDAISGEELYDWFSNKHEEKSMEEDKFFWVENWGTPKGPVDY